MTPDELKRFFPQSSASTIKRNRDTSMGAVETEKPESDRRGKKQDRQLAEGPFCVVVRCEITAYRRRLLDAHENHPYSFKHLVDAIAADLGVPDNDPRLVWRFHQVKTDGEEGVIVKISRDRD